MLDNIFWILVGAFIGWNFPQPQMAKDFQAKYLAPIWAWVRNKIPFLP